MPFRGIVFQHGTANVIADQAKLHFYVDGEGGEPRFLERQPRTWSEIYAQQARQTSSS